MISCKGKLEACLVAVHSPFPHPSILFSEFPNFSFNTALAKHNAYLIFAKGVLKIIQDESEASTVQGPKENPT